MLDFKFYYKDFEIFLRYSDFLSCYVVGFSSDDNRFISHIECSSRPEAFNMLFKLLSFIDILK